MLKLFETQEQSLDRERRKFRTHVSSEVQRFTRGQEEIQARRVREAQREEQERRQKISFERRRFTELVTPTLDKYANDFNAEQDRVDGERSRFRELIEPRLEQERGRIVGIESERDKFRKAVGPSLEALGGVGGGFDVAGGQPARRFATGGGEATATAQGRSGALARALNEEVPGFFFNYKNQQAFGSSRGGIPEGVRLSGEISSAQAVKLAQRLDAGEFGDPSWPDNVGLRQTLRGITEQGVRGRLGGSVVGDVIGALGDQPALGGFPTQALGVGGPSVSDVLSEVHRRYLKPGELVGGRLFEAAAETFPRGISVGTQGIGGQRTGGAEEIGKVPRDVEVAFNAAIGGPEDQVVLDERLTEIGLPARILGAVVQPDNLIGLGLLDEVRQLRFLRGLGNLRRGAGIEDDAARFTVDVLKRADVSAPAFRQVGTAADISGQVTTDITPRAADVLATGATDVSGRVGADVSPRIADVPLATADIAGPRTGDVTALGNLAGANINRAGTSITRAGVRAGDVSVGGGQGVTDIRLAGEASEIDNTVIGREVYLSPKGRTTGTVVSLSDDGSTATVEVTTRSGKRTTKDLPADELVPVGGRRGDLAVGGRAVDSTFDEAVEWYTRAIDEQRANILDNKGRIKRGRATQAAAGERAEQDALARGASAEEAFRAKRSAQRGELGRATQVVIEPPENVKSAIWKRVNEFDFGRGTTGPDFERDRVKSVLLALEGGGRDFPIAEGELLSLEKVLGTHFMDSVRGSLTKGKDGFWHTAWEMAVTPKAVLSSLDLSYPLRQGIMAAPGHIPEFGRSFVPMIRAGWSERAAKEVLEAMLQDPYLVRFTDGTSVSRGQLKQQMGLLRSLDPKSAAAEEVFRSTFAEKWFPFVRPSNRAFTTFGNKFRSDMFDTVIETWARRNIPIDEDRVLALSNMLNRFTGRGTLGPGKAGRAVTDAAQAVMWAPQYRLSGPEALLTLKHPDKLIRAEAWRNMAAYVGTGSMILAAADVTGAGEIGVNPMSADFGKIKIGNTRINIWGTNAVLVRTIVRALAAQRELVGLPAADRNNPAQIGFNYIRSGFAPEWAFLADLVDEQNIIGEDVSLKPEGFRFQRSEGLQKVVERNIVPLWLQDVKEAFEEDGLWAALGVAPAAFFGTGIQAYGGDPSSQIRDMPKWEHVPLEDERELRDFIVEVEQAYSLARRQHPDSDFTQADVAMDMGQKTNRVQLGNWAAGAITNKLPLNEERMTFALDNQDELDDKTLAYALPVAIARKYLTDENFERYNKVEK